MHLIKKNSEYNLVGFGAASIEQQLDILYCFMGGQNDEMLFQHTETSPEQLDDELLEELKKSDFEGYCSGTYLHRYAETKAQVDKEVKELLYEAALKSNSFFGNDLSEEEYKDSLFQDLINGNQDGIDNETLAEIRDIIFLSYWNEKDKNYEEFIRDRTKFVNFDLVVGEHIPYDNRDIKVVWYVLHNRLELKKVIENEGSFTLVVIGKGSVFQSFYYAVTMVEGRETHDLIIVEKQEGCFEKAVLPRIKQVVPNLVISGI